MAVVYTAEQWGRDGLFNNWGRIRWFIYIDKKRVLVLISYHIKQIIPKWLLDLNVKGKSITFLEGNIEEFTLDLGTAEIS